MYRSVLFTSFKAELRPQLSECINYLVYQVEKCPTTNKLHIQGYAEFTKRMRLKAVQQELGDEVAHIEGRRGKVSDAVKYCTKEDTRVEGPFIMGESTNNYSGKRTDIHEVAQCIINREPMKEIAMEYPEAYIKYWRGMERLNDLLTEDREVDKPPHCIWIWGPSGSGKSSLVYDSYPHNAIYKKMASNTWWDGYNQHPIVLLDDFKGNISTEDILTWFDRYPCIVEVKGGTKKLNSPIMIVTSINGPGAYGEEVERRFNTVLYRPDVEPGYTLPPPGSGNR